MKIMIFILIFSIFLNSDEIQYENGWQIRGCDSNLTTEQIIKNNTNINSIWAYKNNTWYAYIKNGTNKKTNNLSTINKNEGFWINAQSSGSFAIPSQTHSTTYKLNIKTNWNIYATSRQINSTNFNNEKIKIVWAFNNKLNRWKAYSYDADTKKLIKNAGIELIDKISPYEGFWINARGNVTITLQNEEEFNSAKVYGINVYARELPFEKYKLTPLSDEEFNNLSEENKFLVANKLLGSLFYGFDYKKLKALFDSGRFISTIQEMFSQDTTPQEIIEVDKKMDYYIHNREYSSKRIYPILARLYELKPSKYFIDNWTAYILTQTILFSPAYELRTVQDADIMDVYRRLANGFEDGYSLQWVTFLHMISDENWRRFRSPEDNGREMLEIYLMDFNDSHVPLAAKALKNWKLDRRSNTLEITFDKNRKPITNLFSNTTVTDGFDFYSKLVRQPNFLKTVITRLVDIYFPNFNSTKKNEVIDKIIKTNPTTWQDVLKEIVFSKEYLLYSKKVKSMEEVFYQTTRALHFDAKYNTFSTLNYYLIKSNQSTMKYKLGRKAKVPLDTQSFAWYQKAVVNYILTNYENNTSLESSDDGWYKLGLFKDLPPELFGDNELRDDGKRLHDWYPYEKKRAMYIVNYLFYSIASRKPSDEEMTFLTDLIDEEKRYNDKFDNYYYYILYGNKKPQDDLAHRAYYAMLILDYISRLDDIYIFKAVKDK